MPWSGADLSYHNTYFKKRQHWRDTYQALKQSRCSRDNHQKTFYHLVYGSKWCLGSLSCLEIKWMMFLTLNGGHYDIGKTFRVIDCLCIKYKRRCRFQVNASVHGQGYETPTTRIPITKSAGRSHIIAFWSEYELRVIFLTRGQLQMG